MEYIVQKFKEGLMAVVPITVIVLILNFTILSLDGDLIWKFIIGAIFIVLGLSIFLIGADLSIVPMGSHMGVAIVKTKKFGLLLIFGFILGFLITVAEPSLQILALQVNDVTAGTISNTSILIVVSIGVGILLVGGLLRIIYNISLPIFLTVSYGLILILSVFSSTEFLAVAFDASGATTGAMAVPFILSIGVGVSAMKAGKASEDDSFGMVGLASIGPIIAVLAMGIIAQTDTLSNVPSEVVVATHGILRSFLVTIPQMAFDVFISLSPLIGLFLIFQVVLIKLSKRKLTKILKGVIYTFIGLVLFLTGVNAGFMEAGSAIGFELASLDKDWLLLLIAFIFGLAVILAEPAVYLLTEQVEEVTSGHIKKGTMLFALGIGVAFAVSLSILRIMVPALQLWHILLPLYLIALALTYLVPKVFVGIAFDSGGVASGPMNGTFILAFAQGAADSMEGADVLIAAFGIIALVALTPLIAIQILGLIYRIKSAKEVNELEPANK